MSKEKYWWFENPENLRKWTIRNTNELVQWVDSPWEPRLYVMPTDDLDEMHKWKMHRIANNTHIMYWMIDKND